MAWDGKPCEYQGGLHRIYTDDGYEEKMDKDGNRTWEYWFRAYCGLCGADLKGY